MKPKYRVESRVGEAAHMTAATHYAVDVIMDILDALVAVKAARDPDIVAEHIEVKRRRDCIADCISYIIELATRIEIVYDESILR